MAPAASKPVAVAAPSPSPPSSLPANDNVAHAIAGAGGGILSTVLTYPLITLSTRAQVESRRADSSFWAAVEHIVAREGVAGLYAGLDSAVFGIGVTNFVYYYWYEWARGAFARRSGAARLSTVDSMLAGAIAGSATVILTNPIWVVNTRMTTRRRSPSAATAAASQQTSAKAGTPSPAAVAKSETDEESGAVVVEPAVPAPVPAPAPAAAAAPSSTIATLLALLRDEGPQALFAGVVPALVLVINPILQYTLFEQLKNAVQTRRRTKTGASTDLPISPATAFVLGAIGKLFATAITYPYITVKSRMHVATHPSQRAGGVTAALKRVVREEGYTGLYRGIGPKITQSVLTAALLFALKDVLYAQTVRLRAAKALRA